MNRFMNFLSKLRSKNKERKVRFKSHNKGRSVLKSSPHHKKMSSSKYKGLNKNRDCKNLDFMECSSVKIDPMSDFEIIGAGSFGILIKARSMDGRDLAIKFLFNVDKHVDMMSKLDMEKELSYSYYMGKIGIGPEVLDSFYYVIESDDLYKYKTINSIVKNILNNEGKANSSVGLLKNRYRNVPIEIQCIVMEAYQMDCSTALSSEEINMSTKIEIIKQMTRLIKSQIEHKVFCSDIKPGNFVVNVYGKVDVKMIDFGVDFCKEDKIYVYALMDTSVFKESEILYIFNVIQTYLIAVDRGYFDEMPKDEVMELIRTFFRSSLFNTFFKMDWETFVHKYVSHAELIYSKGLLDPSSNLVWYATGGQNFQGTLEKVTEYLKLAVVARSGSFKSPNGLKGYNGLKGNRKRSFKTAHNSLVIN